MSSISVSAQTMAFLGIFEVKTANGPMREATWLRDGGESVLTVSDQPSDTIEKIRARKEAELLIQVLPGSEGKWVEVRAVPYKRDLHPHRAYTGHDPVYRFGRLSCCTH